MYEILVEDNVQQNLVSMKNAVIEMRLSTKIGDCHTGALRKMFRVNNSEKHETKFLGDCN